MKLPRDISGAETLKALGRLHRNLVAGTLQSILRQAGVTLEDFVNAL